MINTLKNNIFRNSLILLTFLQLSCGWKSGIDKGKTFNKYQDFYYINEIEVIKKSEKLKILLLQCWQQSEV